MSEIHDRLNTIEQDIKKLISITSALQTDQRRIQELEEGQKDLLEFKNKTRGALLLVYIFLAIFGGSLLEIFSRPDSSSPSLSPRQPVHSSRNGAP